MQILRDEWGFTGYCFSDYSGIHRLQLTHRTAATLQEAGKQALEAGMDLEAPETVAWGEKLLDLVNRGEVSIDLIDRAVQRILRVKFLAGLFENPYPDVDRAAEITSSPPHRKLARQIATESIILLKNEKNLLPLQKDLKSIAVIGPNANVAQLGDYTYLKDDLVTPLDGIRAAVSKKTKINYAQGCGLFELSKEGFAEAVDAAKNSEIAIVVTGEASVRGMGVGWGMKKPETVCTGGENFDRSELDLPGVQQDLLEAIVATRTPTILVMVHGRPATITWAKENVPAIIEAWYPGEQGGNALADIIFGKVSPSGKLPVSIPQQVGQIPVNYNHKPSARCHSGKPGSPGNPGRDYVFASPAPLYNFGHGLSYTTFKYKNLRITPKQIPPTGKVTVSVEVTNTGKRPGQEVVQLYINDLVSSVTTPVKVLRNFKKINLKPAQTQKVEFVLTKDDLSLINEEMQTVVEPGEFEVMVGNLKEQFTVK